MKRYLFTRMVNFLALFFLAILPALAPAKPVSAQTAPTLYENYYAVQDNTGMGLHAAQTFSPLATHTLTQIK